MLKSATRWGALGWLVHVGAPWFAWRLGGGHSWVSKGSDANYKRSPLMTRSTRGRTFTSWFHI